jgi:hypothetical protein
MFKNKLLWRIFGCKKEEVMVAWFIMMGFEVYTLHEIFLE